MAGSIRLTESEKVAAIAFDGRVSRFPGVPFDYDAFACTIRNLRVRVRLLTKLLLNIELALRMPNARNRLEAVAPRVGRALEEAFEMYGHLQYLLPTDLELELSDFIGRCEATLDKIQGRWREHVALAAS